VRFLYLAITLGLALPVPHVVAGDITNKELQDRCADKTIVMGRDEKGGLVKAGEKIDGYCAGYLQASFSAFTRTTKCKNKDQSSIFLLSVYDQYRKDKEIPDTAIASETLFKAFKRIPGCN